MKLYQRATSGEALDLYRLFAFALGAPTAERYQWFEQEALAGWLAQLWTGLGCEGAFPGVERFDNYQDYESTYISLFDVGVPEPVAPLLESAHYKARPAQLVALENSLFYEVAGLKTDASIAVPDFLLTQLEFLAAVRYAQQQEKNNERVAELRRLEKDFLDRHLLNWIPAAEAKLERLQPPVFPVFLKFLLAFLRLRRDELEAH